MVSKNAEADQISLLRVREATSASTLVEVMEELFPSYEASANANYALGDAATPAEISEVVASFEADKLVPQRIRTRLAAYASSLSQLLSG